MAAQQGAMRLCALRDENFPCSRHTASVALDNHPEGIPRAPFGDRNRDARARPGQAPGSRTAK
jgi:hypothetical protein